MGVKGATLGQGVRAGESQARSAEGRRRKEREKKKGKRRKEKKK
jgi:hypothetical protein